MYIYHNYLFNVKLQRLIYDRNLTGVEELCTKHRSFYLEEHTLEFLDEIEPSRKTVNIIKYLKNRFENHRESLDRTLYFHEKIIWGIEVNENKKSSFESRLK